MYSKCPFSKPLATKMHTRTSSVDRPCTIENDCKHPILCARQIRYFPYIDADDGPYEESQVRLSDAMPKLQWSFTSFVSLHSQIEGRNLLGRYGVLAALVRMVRSPLKDRQHPLLSLPSYSVGSNSKLPMMSTTFALSTETSTLP